MKPTLEKLTEGGWTEVGQWLGDCQIYRKENKRILYDSVKDKVVMKYNYKENPDGH